MSSIAILALASLGLLLMVLGWKVIRRWLAGPDEYREQTIEDVKRFIHSLRLTVGEDGILIISHRDSDRFIQFVKYSRDNKAYLHFALPEVIWAQDAFPIIQDICRERGFTCQIRPVEGPIIRKFLEVELAFSDEGDEEAVFDFSTKVFSSLGLSLQERFSIQFSGAPNHDYARELASAILKEEPDNPLKRKALEWSSKTLEKHNEESR